MNLRTALARPVWEAAPHLLGCRVVSGVGGAQVVLRLTEVEAYGGVDEDPGSHAFRGPTARNASMFARAGTAYVYLCYGMHWCLNISAGAAGQGAAVLLRAGEVLAGRDAACARRGTDRNLARGPGRLAQALGVTGALDGIDLLDPASPVRIEPRAGSTGAVLSGPRTGVSGAGASTPWRFHLEGEPSVSPYRAAMRKAPARSSARGAHLSG